MSPRLPFSVVKALLIFGLLFAIAGAYAQDVWNAPALSADPESLRHAATEIKPGKDAEVTILLNEFNISFDSAGRMVKQSHLIYRIETQDAVEGWAEIKGNWEPWYQAKPEVRARVITSDGAVHLLDPKTLNDLPVHQDTPGVYSDERAYGGPLPALAPGAIGEEEVITRDTSLFFPAGISEAYWVGRSVPVHKTRFVISHPESLPVRYVLRLLPEAVVKKSTTGGVETIVIEQGPLEAYTDKPQNSPPEAVFYPTLEITTGTSWQQVAAAYVHQTQDKLRISDVQPLVSKLGVKAGSNLDAVHKIVSALHKNVRYTGVEFGESNLIPQFPNETLKRRYGDCKDKSALLVTMLHAAGIPANLALLSSGPDEDVDPEMPGMGGFDHAIVHVPATDSSPELWIDATAEYSRVGDLPSMDYGRWALIADEKTTALTKTPELTSDKNLHVETREFTLADFGPATIVERSEQSGPTDNEYRDYYDGDLKKIKENGEKYVKDAYLADSLTSLDTTDPEDLDKAFVLTLKARGRRGFTEVESATVYIDYAFIFNSLPDYFLSKKEKKEVSEQDAAKPRTVDWVITPFITEWRYRITAPAGFKVRALPPDKDAPLGAAHFVQKYSSKQDGTIVEAVLRFDSGKGRLTIKEADELRDAIVKARSADGISINFDQIGYSLVSAGKIKEGLAADRQLVADHPKDALPRVRLARAFLSAGLAEKARSVIKEAAALDPKSAQVFLQQGWILEHDLIGRRHARGFDYSGAISTYRKAKQLDPKDKDIRATLAMLLEYDTDGTRYSPKAHLEEAIAEFNELKKLDEAYARTYQDFVAYDLWYLGRFKELYDYVVGLPSTDVRKAFILASIAATDGADAAIKKSLEITSEEENRNQAITTADRMLLQIRRYPEAGALFAIGARGQSNESQTLAFGERLKKTRRSEELNVDASSPSSVIHKLFRLLFSPDFTPDAFAPITSKFVVESAAFKDANTQTESRQVLFGLRAQARKSGMPLEALADIALSNARYSTEGNDSLGYKVRVETPGSARSAFVVREDGQFKLVDFNVQGKTPESLAWEVLLQLDNNDLPGARKWLDWAREEMHISAGDDPLSGQPFPRFWTKGQEADADTICTAALILLSSRDLKGKYLATLIEARDNAKSDAGRTELNLVLAYAYEAHEQWAELRAVAEELMKTAPDSFIAFQFETRAFAHLKQFDDWDKLLQVRMQKHPDELDYIRSAAGLAQYRGDFGKARELMKIIIDQGKAAEGDLNIYAWNSLFISGNVDGDAIVAAERGSELSKQSDFSVMHTLACLYAQAGRTKEARSVLLKAMDAQNLEEPNSAVWLALAMIAEQYGEADSARIMYSRTERQNLNSPTSNYALAQQRLAALQNEGVSAKAGVK